LDSDERDEVDRTKSYQAISKRSWEIFIFKIATRIAQY